MKLGIMQPYFLPYIGYFQLIKAVDQYVIYDDVNYIKGGWINRNNLLINGEKRLFTITLKGASPNKLINEIEIGDDFKKFQKTLQANYTKAPYYDDISYLIDNIINYENKNLSQFITNCLKVILDYLSINTRIISSSQLSKDCTLKGKDKVINICKHLGSDTYINAIGGQELYNKNEFRTHGINLKFLKTEIVPYNQLKNEFVPYLSILDVLMFNSIDEINCMLDKYDLL